MTSPALPDKVVSIHDRLTEDRMPHAFGGALALAYYGEPRMTLDIDVNLFVEPERHGEVVAALAPLGIDDTVDDTIVERDGQCRLAWDSTPVDIFYAYDDLHSAMRVAARKVPFGSDEIPILAPEHLLVCKAVFNRPKDWLDIEQILVGVPDLDRDEVARWLQRIVGADDPRSERVASLAASL